MPVKKCRVCSHDFFAEPLLRYDNMPKAAQFLPDAGSLENEHGVDLEVCQCAGCGLVQLSNDPVPYHKEVIRAAAYSPEMKEFRMRQFGDFIQKYSLQGKKIIELGCGRGEYMSLMRQCGAETYGIEYSSESVEQCVKDGLNVAQKYIDSSEDKLDNAPFDAFFILNFLEHMPDPNSALRGMCANLTEDGIGLVEVPNFNMIIRNKLFSEFIGDHLFYFTRETLNATLSMNGFEVVECSDVWHEYIISSVVRKRKKLDIAHFYNYQAKLKSEIEAYIKQHESNQVAIWGAGHQALAIIALANLSGKIKYVVDSAVFKQGKYTPATHLRIVSPDALDSDPVAAIIVMAASYSDEVARIIRQKHGSKIKIAILRDFGLETV